MHTPPNLRKHDIPQFLLRAGNQGFLIGLVVSAADDGAYHADQKAGDPDGWPSTFAILAPSACV